MPPPLCHPSLSVRPLPRAVAVRAPRTMHSCRNEEHHFDETGDYQSPILCFAADDAEMSSCNAHSQFCITLLIQRNRPVQLKQPEEVQPGLHDFTQHG